jgi:ribosomal protein L7/L12
MIVTLNNGTVVEVLDGNNKLTPTMFFTKEQFECAQRMLWLVQETTKKILTKQQRNFYPHTEDWKTMKIQVIKLLRTKFSLGLAEAKALYETAEMKPYEEYTPSNLPDQEKVW